MRNSAWKPVFHGVYADADLDLTHVDRCALVSRYFLRRGGVIAGRSAVSLYTSLDAHDATQPVEVIMPAAVRTKASGLTVHLGQVSAAEMFLRSGIPITTPDRTAWDLAQWLDVVEAVALVDVLAANGLVTASGLESFAQSRKGTRGWKKLQRVSTLVDSGAQSRPESRLRVRLVLAGVPQPVTQFVVVHNGEFIAKPDLAWPESRTAVEYDGLWHVGSAGQMDADRRRLNRLAAAGWVVLHVTAKRLRDDFEGFVAELMAVLESRRPVTT